MTRTRWILILCVLALCAVPFVAWGLANARSPRSDGDDRSKEGPESTVTEYVERMGPESEGRVPVAVRMHAQMYYLYRADPGFVESLRLLRDAESSKRVVRITFRSYSGRIVAVASAD